MKFRLLAIVALLFGAIGLGAYTFLAPKADGAPKAAPAAPPVPAVMTVRNALPPGHILRPDDLAPLPWPGGTPPAAAIRAGTPAAHDLVGALTRRAFAAGELIVPGAVIGPGDRGFLAAIVSPGKRAIAVGVDATTAAGGLIWPGDHVDLILTQEIREDGVALAQSVVSETILEDVRVLSIDQRLGHATDGSEETDKAPRIPATVTLEVLPQEAERVTVGSTLGRLHLTLRSAASVPATPEPGAPTWAGGVSPALATVRPRPDRVASAAPRHDPSPAPQAPAEPRGVRILRGSAGAS